MKLMLGASFHSEVVIDGALLLCTLFNENIALLNQNSKAAGGARLCSNTFPGLMAQPKKIDVGIILQIISKQRSELCCLSLISCLLISCQSEVNLGMNEDESETSSMEILKALTFHINSPIQEKNHPMNRVKSAPLKSGNTLMIERPAIVSDPEAHQDPAIQFFDNMVIENSVSPVPFLTRELDGMELLEQLIHDEETNIANILLKCVKLCPSAFDVQLKKSELVKWVDKGARGLWTQVGSTLEHVVLWWSNAPLACRPVSCTRHLRDWLLVIHADDAPEPILSTLKGLGETLTVHVASTTWDKQFRLALVASSLPVDYPFENTEFHCPSAKINGTVPGRIWSELLYSLVTFTNNCDQNGTIPNELPIVEQIPVLHRLDHSIHTMRLWAAAKSKSLSSEWNMKMFFLVVHNDIRLCLEQLQELRVPVLAATDLLEVHLQVCVALRAKLVSEVKINIQKLKQTTAQCIEILASICKTTSLATLTLCFPVAKYWQTEQLNDDPSDYVTYYLEEVFLPCVKATNDFEIISLILKILCEAWLDHIYTRKVKFSRSGAINLLKDFDGVSEWISSCEHVPLEFSEKLAKHEVLRMCEGVGRLLLRKPEDIISMIPSTRLVRSVEGKFLYLHGGKLVQSSMFV